MTDHEARFTRRALLAATVAVAAGCTSRRRAEPSNPDEPMVAAARAGELALLATAAAGTAAYAAHAAHLQALGGHLPAAGSSTPAPTAPAAYADVAGSVPVLQAAAQHARDGATAAKLASIAASHGVLARAPK